MPWNAGTYTRTDGTYSGATVFQQQAAAGIDIEANLLDAEGQDMAEGINNTLAKDGTNEPTANLPMDDFRHAGVAVASGSLSASEYASGRTAQAGVISDGGTTGGSDTAFTAALPFAPAAYVDKALYRAKFHAPFGAVPTINFNALGTKKMYATGAAAQLTTGQVPADYIALLRYDASLDGGNGGFALLNVPPPIGAVIDFAGATPPPGWLLCSGQNVSRTTYAALFAVIGTTYGAGDGSTTFGLPDLRGRAIFGKDDMGGSAANRVTSGGSGINGASLGAAGGSQLLQQHAHGVSDPTHAHGVSDPSHSHGYLVNTLGTVQGGAASAFSAQTSGNTNASGTGISIQAAGTGISIQNAGSGTSQNMPPAMIMNKIIFAGA